MRMIEIARPPLAPEALPATTAAAPRAAARETVRVLLGLGAAVFAATFLALWAFEGFADITGAAGAALLPALVFAALALVQARRARGLPERLALTLSREGVAVESEFGRSDTPLAAFAGVASRYEAEPPGWGPPRETVHREQRPVGAPRRWHPARGRAVRAWVELVHPDPARSVPLWVSRRTDGADEARPMARRFAAALGKPLLGSHVRGEEAARIMRDPRAAP